MSSRLFQEARERRGLCYSIYSGAWGLADGGMFNIHAATGTEQLPEVRDVIIEELRKAAADHVTDRELERAKAGLKAGLLMSLESSSARAEQMARQMIGFGRLIEPEELTERVEAVTAEDIRSFAAGLASAGKAAVAVVGPGGASTAFAEETHGRLAA
jgi:predicted Zn-dependent peptidase